MAQTNVNIKMDEELKKQFEKLCTDIGMTMTTAFCMFARLKLQQILFIVLKIWQD